jgi:UDP-N-acetylglucosamine--N-acetylmuramyl-(pentapeptide) pyrophosphoryl-undecaprenol N-acetylglucosamine transferase
VVPEAIASMAENARPEILHQAGGAHAETVRRAYERLGVRAEVQPFVTDMAREYAAADLMICRAGASTIAEVAAAGVAAVLVPFPFAVDDHQTHNARYLSERGAAILIPQADLTPEKLATLLAGFTRDQLAAMARAARSAGKPEATRAVAEACMALVG